MSTISDILLISLLRRTGKPVNFDTSVLNSLKCWNQEGKNGILGIISKSTLPAAECCEHWMCSIYRKSNRNDHQSQLRRTVRMPFCLLHCANGMRTSDASERNRQKWCRELVRQTEPFKCLPRYCCQCVHLQMNRDLLFYAESLYCNFLCTKQLSELKEHRSHDAYSTLVAQQICWNSEISNKRNT